MKYGGVVIWFSTSFSDNVPRLVKNTKKLPVCLSNLDTLSIDYYLRTA